MRKLRLALEHAGVLLLAAAGRILPLRAASALGAGIGRFVWGVVGFRRRVTRENLRRALAGGPDPDRLGAASYACLGRTLTEFLALEGASPEKVAELAPLEGAELLDRALARGAGAVLVTGHFGNWELFGATIAAHGYPIDVVVGPQSNPHVDRLINRVRRSLGVGVIPRGMAVRGVIRAIRRGRFVAIVADQDAGEEGTFVDFFGTPASTPRGPAVFSLRLGCPLLFGVNQRLGGDRHRAHVLCSYEPEPSGDEDRDVHRLTAAYTRVLESWIRRLPDHYLWSHRRWKTRPGEGAAGATPVADGGPGGIS